MARTLNLVWNFAARAQSLKRLSMVAIALVCILLSSCSLPRVNAEDRLFLGLSLEFLGAYDLPQISLEGAPPGGLSAIAYDRQVDRFYAVSDDRSNLAPARFYTLKLNVSQSDGAIGIGSVDVEKVTALRDRDGNPFPAGSLDPEGIALSPLKSVFISSEGVANEGIAPFISEFDLETGQLKRSLPIPERYLPKANEDGTKLGVQNNLGFEALTLNPGGSSPTFLEPYRLFAALESPLQQDIPETEPAAEEPAQPLRSRFLHYLIADDKSTLLAEHLYLIEPPTPPAAINGLTELLVLDSGGHFLSLERSLGLTGFGAQLFQLATGSATDISGIPTLKGDVSGIEAIRKRLVFDLNQLEIPLGNLEGMTLGPRLPDGSSSLVLVSDNNLNEALPNQFLLFRLKGL